MLARVAPLHLVHVETSAARLQTKRAAAEKAQAEAASSKPADRHIRASKARQAQVSQQGPTWCMWGPAARLQTKRAAAETAQAETASSKTAGRHLTRSRPRTLCASACSSVSHQLSCQTRHGYPITPGACGDVCCPPADQAHKSSGRDWLQQDHRRASMSRLQIP